MLYEGPRWGRLWDRWSSLSFCLRQRTSHLSDMKFAHLVIMILVLSFGPILVCCWQVNPGMSCQFVGTWESLITTGMCARVGFFTGVRSDMPGLHWSISISTFVPMAPSGVEMINIPDVPACRTPDHIEDICMVEESCSYPYSTPPPSTPWLWGHWDLIDRWQGREQAQGGCWGYFHCCFHYWESCCLWMTWL